MIHNEGGVTNGGSRVRLELGGTRLDPGWTLDRCNIWNVELAKIVVYDMYTTTKQFRETPTPKTQPMSSGYCSPF